MADLSAFIGAAGTTLSPGRFTEHDGLPVFHPESAEEAAGFFRLANERHQPLLIRGRGSNGTAARGDIVVVASDRLASVGQLSTEDYYITVGAGFPLREIAGRLSRLNLSLPHATLPYDGTAGGAVAVGLAAERNGVNIPIKRYLVKAQVVTPPGEIVEPGSICFKSVSGYDIVKIFAGSWGLLGFLASVTFRVMPAAFVGEQQKLRMLPVDRQRCLVGLDESNQAVDVVYSRKLKAKLDPGGILSVR